MANQWKLLQSPHATRVSRKGAIVTKTTRFFQKASAGAAYFFSLENHHKTQCTPVCSTTKELPSWRNFGTGYVEEVRRMREPHQPDIH